MAVIDIDPEVAPFVQQAYTKAASGIPGRSVLRWVQSLPSSARGGKVLNHRSVRQILSSPTYVGQTSADGELLPGRWPALIDRETWDRVQQRMTEHQHMPRQASRRYLLTGLLRCPRCGARMHGTTNSKVFVYRCSGILGSVRASVEAHCHYSTGQPTVDATVLGQVGALLETLSAQDSAFQDALRRAWRLLQQGSVQADSAHRVQKLERDRERAQERLRRAAILFVDGALDRTGYDLARDTAQADLEAAQAEIDRIQPTAPVVALPPLDEVLRQLGGWSLVLEGGDIAAKRDVLGLLIERATPVRIGFGKYDVQIVWTQLGEGLRHLVGAVGANV
jgi:site-specific DNA recombinase